MNYPPILQTFLIAFCSLSHLSCHQDSGTSSTHPNILFIIADDWSYPHAGILGDSAVQTPHIDRMAKEGLVFHHAYVSSPSCTPSRAAILTGQDFWRLKEGANLYGPLKPDYPVYTDLLEQEGYHVGYTEKGWGPGDHPERSRNPAGDFFQSFDEFLDKKPSGSPFCFWFGSHNPHRGYVKDSGEEAGIDLASIQVPGCFPDNEIIRGDLADYYKEVQDFDAQVGAILDRLERSGDMDNTLIVITGDNGMPFPRCKNNLYDLGTRVPLIMRWKKGIASHNDVSDFVSLTDLAPTFLEMIGLPLPQPMTGRSLLPYLSANIPVSDSTRQQVFFGKERHVPSQEDGDWGGYASRAIRTHEFLLIQNFRPNRWPAGTPNYEQATLYPSFYAGVDGGPTRTFMLDNRDQDEAHQKLFSLAFDKRPELELYDLKQDPDQLRNVAEDEAYAEIRTQLQQELIGKLRETGDPRIIGGKDIFESYPYTGGTISPPNFNRKSRRYATIKLEDFPSKHIGSRTVEILTPINVHHGERFPVLYMFDGQNIFHSFKGWGGKMNKGWRVSQVLDSLNRTTSIPPMIVVGIFNSEKRMSEYMPAKPQDLLKKRIAETKSDWYKIFQTEPPQSDDQLRFLIEEVKPYVDQHFLSLPDQQHTFVGGSSMGGLMAAYAICEYPVIFGGAACFSTHWPALDGVFLEYFKTHLPDPSSHKLYFDHGTEGLDAEYEPFQMIADEAIKSSGYEVNSNWITRTFDGAKHHEDDWHDRFHVPLEFFFKGAQK